MSENYGLKFVVNGEDYDKIKKSLNEQIEDLQQKVEQLEKDKSYANWYAVKKEKEVEQLENIIKEAIEYINKNWGHWCSNHCKYATETINILNKGDNK